MRLLSKKLVAYLGIALAVIAAAPANKRAPSNGLKFIDLTSDFDRVWNATKDLPDDRRVEAFEADFAKILPSFYDPKRVADHMSAVKFQAHVLEGLKQYPSGRANIQRVSRQFVSLISPAQRSFERAFGPMRGYPEIYLVNSLGEFDGGERDLPNGTHLMFGADMIAKLHGKGPIQPFFHHELFHVLNHRSFKDCDRVWCSLWSEGLAVYVASKLNPRSNDDALLLTIPVPLRTAVERHKTEAICAVRKRLDSSSPADLMPLFSLGGDGLSPDLPPRFGYYVGYLVAQDVGHARNLKTLATLQDEQVRPLVEKSLKHMADCA